MFLIDIVFCYFVVINFRSNLYSANIVNLKKCAKKIECKTVLVKLYGRVRYRSHPSYLSHLSHLSHPNHRYRMDGPRPPDGAALLLRW